MEFEHLVRIVGDEPVFETGLLLAGDVNLRDVHCQLSRWTKAGWLYLTQENLKRLLRDRTVREGRRAKSEERRAHGFAEESKRRAKPHHACGGGKCEDAPPSLRYGRRLDSASGQARQTLPRRSLPTAAQNTLRTM